MEYDAYSVMAKETHRLFRSFLAVGFTEEQAMELTKSQYAFAVVNYQIDQQRRKERTATLSANIRRYRESLKQTENETEIKED